MKESLERIMERASHTLEQTSRTPTFGLIPQSSKAQLLMQRHVIRSSGNSLEAELDLVCKRYGVVGSLLGHYG